MGLYDPVQKTINDGAWHNLVHTFDRTGDGTTYLDGVKVNHVDISALASADFTIPENSWEIGQAGGGTYTEAANFDMDDLGFWRRALSEYEARAIYIVGNASGVTFDGSKPTITTVTLTIQANGNALTLGWSNGTLESSASVNGGWTAVTGASAPSFTVTPSAGQTQLFYRVRVN